MSDKETTPKPTLKNYRGACIEDLQLPPAFCLPQDAPVISALEAAYEKEFDHLPILNYKRKPIGYLDIPLLKAKIGNDTVKQNESVSNYMTHFTLSKRSPSYVTITPLTSLEELESFFETRDVSFALVTDAERNWVLAVATREDLETFVKRRG
ncbi:uncharacterized protein L203_106235 [Cryptococcus depauperatus CBS 7841]|uniref:Uncharacterized protein n=1 Tax=Cryptococcus depauperatus CBS 7841 TaxID=1295531 RepID=A0A1E3IJG9_9TREE|nr:hypothetical protein L203_02763 [Cryptococcus depauperatus CBS 7841]